MRASSAADASAACRSSSAALKGGTRTSLETLPAAGRSSAGSVPSPRRTPVSEPFLPRYSIRTESSVGEVRRGGDGRQAIVTKSYELVGDAHDSVASPVGSVPLNRREPASVLDQRIQGREPAPAVPPRLAVTLARRPTRSRRTRRLESHGPRYRAVPLSGDPASLLAAPARRSVQVAAGGGNRAPAARATPFSHRGPFPGRSAGRGTRRLRHRLALFY